MIFLRDFDESNSCFAQVYAPGCDIFCQTNEICIGTNGNIKSFLSLKVWNKIYKRLGIKMLEKNKPLRLGLDSILGIKHEKPCSLLKEIFYGFAVKDSFDKKMNFVQLNQDKLYDTILLARESKDVDHLVLLIPDNLILPSEKLDFTQPSSLSVNFLHYHMLSCKIQSICINTVDFYLFV
jgi:hypothetical protein